MRMLTKLSGLSGLALVGLLGAGCTYLSPVELDATPADMEILVGDWRGEYESQALGRSGSIEFKLLPGEAGAHGNVLMIPRGATQPYERSYGSDPADAQPDPFRSRALTIRFARSYEGSISGDLDPYWDPDSNCLARSTFRGSLEVGKMEGTFTTHLDCNGTEATGTWKMTRKPLSTTSD